MQTPPKVIETEAENKAALAIVEKLILKGDDKRSPEEEAALDLLATLIEQFEEKAYPLPSGDPVGALKLMMESHKLKAINLSDIFGSRGRTSEVLSGKRSISKEQAKRLEERFKVSPAVFI
jgi:HTH-type transcriptional regulator/antitoxin HigA